MVASHEQPWVGAAGTVSHVGCLLWLPDKLAGIPSRLIDGQVLFVMIFR